MLVVFVVVVTAAAAMMAAVSAAAAVTAVFDLLPSPFVNPKQCGRPDVSRSAICDPHLYIPQHEKDILEGSLNSLAHLGQGAVAVVDKLSRTAALQNETVASATEAVAKATYTAWGVGRGADDKGFLVFLSLGDRTVYISIGAGLERHVGPDDLTSIISNMKVKLRSGEYGQAILVAVLEIKLLLSLSADDPAQVWGKGGGGAAVAAVGSAGPQHGAPPPPPEIEAAPSSSGFFKPDLFGKRPPPPPPTPPGKKSQEDTNRLRRRGVTVSEESKSDYAKMGTGGADRGPGGGRGPWMLLPVAAIAGSGIYFQAEGQQALRDVVADSRVFSLAPDDVISDRLPTRCPHCFATLATQNGSDTAAAPPKTWWVNVADVTVSRVRTAAGWQAPSRVPGTLSCGHVLCAACIDAVVNRKSWLTKVEQWILPADVRERKEAAAAAAAGGGGGRGRQGRRKRKTQALATTCQGCPVCAAPLSDWSTTLNKVHADQELVESLRASAAALDGPTVSRVEAQLARINRHKEVAYATLRLRRKYGIVAAIDGSFVYDHDSDQYGPYNRRRPHQRGSSPGPGVHFSFGGTGSGSGAHANAPPPEASTALQSSPAAGGSAAGAGKPSSSLAQRLLTTMQRMGSAEATSTTNSDRQTFRASGRSGAASAPSPSFTRNSERSSGPSGAGDSW